MHLFITLLQYGVIVTADPHFEQYGINPTKAAFEYNSGAVFGQGVFTWKWKSKSPHSGPKRDFVCLVLLLLFFIGSSTVLTF